MSISNRVSWAAKYHNAGFIIMPLSGKKPILQKWTSLKYDPKHNIQQYKNTNFGIVLTNADLVIDIDPRNFEKDDNPTLRLTKNLSIKFVSFMVKTGGGGIHVYFKKPENFKIKRAIALYQGIEFKSQGQQVVGAGCIHPDTEKEYVKAYSDPSKIEDAPPELLELLKEDDKYIDIKQEVISDDSSSCNRFSVYLNTQAPSAIQGAGGDVVTYKVACRGRDFGLTPDKTYELMSKLWNNACQPPWDENELKKKIQNAYVYNTEASGKKHPISDFKEIDLKAKKVKIKWDLSKDNKILKTLSNTVNFFAIPNSELNNLLCFNEFTKGIEFLKKSPWDIHNMGMKNWTDSDATHCRYYLSAIKHFDISPSVVHEAALIAAKTNSYHPVRQYLKNLKWDGGERLDKWLINYAGVQENRFSLTIGRKVLVAAVARIFDPGCKFDYMLVLEGKQGLRKGMLVDILGVGWYGDLSLNTQDKDTVDAMRGKWIIEISEMECTRRADAQALKAFITRKIDRVRLPYARYTEDFPRQCIFIGTINPEAVGYLRDTTGNRRFWPVRCINEIKIKKLKQDIKQLWAEAYLTYNLGEELYITDKEINKIALKEADARREQDPWMGTILDFLNERNDTGQSKNIVTVMIVYEDCLHGVKRQCGRMDQIRISNILQLELGWEKGYHYDINTKKTIYGFKRPKINLKELVNN